MLGGQNDRFGTLYEILVFRDIAVSGTNLRLSVDKDQEDFTLAFEADAELLDVFREIVGDDAQIIAQFGDADLGASCIAGDGIGQWKASS